MRRPVPMFVAVTSAVCLLATGCGSDTKDSDAGHDKPQKITVLAAASLKESFTALAHSYKKKTGTDVKLSFAGSQQLAAQVRQGAPADVIATADEKTMKDLDAKVRSKRDFATNRLVMAVRPGNPKHVRKLRDLDRKNVSVVLAADEVPAGRYAKQVLDRAGLKVRPKSKEPDVRATLTKVRLGEADTALVYASDAKAAGKKVRSVPIPDKQNVRANYPIAPVAASDHPAQARKFTSFVTGRSGGATLTHYGFGTP